MLVNPRRNCNFIPRLVLLHSAARRIIEELAQQREGCLLPSEDLRRTGWLRCVTPASDIRRNYVPRSRDGRCASPVGFRGTLCPSLLVEILIVIDLITRASCSGGHNESRFDLHSRDRLDFSVGIVLHPKRCSRNTDRRRRTLASFIRDKYL